MTEGKLTWLAPSDGQRTRDFLRSAYDLVRSSPEPFVATAIPIGAGNLTMLHIVAGTGEGDLISFSDSTIREFETLAAETIARLSEDELASAQRALDSREIGGLSCASGDELAVVAATAKAQRLQDRIAALVAKNG